MLKQCNVIYVACACIIMYHRFVSTCASLSSECNIWFTFHWCTSWILVLSASLGQVLPAKWLQFSWWLTVNVLCCFFLLSVFDWKNWLVEHRGLWIHRLMLSFSFWKWNQEWLFKRLSHGLITWHWHSDTRYGPTSWLLGHRIKVKL